MNTTLISRIRTIAVTMAICCVVFYPQTIQLAYGEDTANVLPPPITSGFSPLSSTFGEAAVPDTPPGTVSTQNSEAEDLVTEVRIEGNRRFSNAEVVRLIQTREGRAYDPKLIEADVRRLVSSRKFLDVQPTTQRTESGRIVTFAVRERAVLTEVKIIGSHDIRRNKLLKKIGIKRGDPADPYTVQQGKILIEEHYKEEGYGNINVEIFEGDKPDDYRVIYIVHEGPKQRIFRVRFEGNQFASDGQLETKIQSKPGILWFFGGSVNRETIEEDVRELEGYYHSFGFFQAEIERDLDWNEDEKWLTLTFHIHEGVRSKIRSIEMAGNKRFEEDYLLPERTITEGEYFSRDKLERDARRIELRYGDVGYVFAKVKPQIQMFEEPGEVNITYAIQEDRQYRIGRVDPKILSGDGDGPRTRWEVVLNGMSAYPGQIANRSEIQASMRRLGRSNCFDTESGKGPDIAYGKPTRTPSRSNNPFSTTPDATPESGDTGPMVAERPGGFRGQSPTTNSTTNSTTNPTTNSPTPLSEPIPVETKYGGYSENDEPQYRFQSPMTRAANPVAVRYDDFGVPLTGGITQGPSVNSVEPSMVRFQNPSVNLSAASGWSSGGTFGTASTGTSIGTTTTGGVLPTQYSGYTPVTATSTPTTLTNPTTPVATTGTVTGEPITPTGTLAGNPVGVTTQTGGTGTYQGILPSNVIPPADGTGIGSYYSGGVGQATTVTEPTAGTTRDPWGLMGDSDPDYYLPLNPTVNEAATGKVMVGAAINSDNGLTGIVTVDEQNFDLLRFPTSWADVVEGRAWRGAGQKFRLELMPGDKVQRYSVTLTNPYLPILQRQLSGSVNGFYYDREYSEWSEHRLGGRASLGYSFPTRPDLSMSLAFRGEQVKIDDIIRTSTPIPDYEKMRGDNNLYGFRFSFNHDVRDNTFLPTEGYYWSVGVEQVLGTFQYLRLDADARWYYLLREHPDQSNRHVLSVLGHAGWTGDDTPVYDRFFLGGTTTLRGFDYRGASVRDNQYGLNIGGNFIMYGSLEYLFPITANDTLRGLVFCDVGTSQPTIDDWSERVRVVPGVGLRIAIPMMGPAPLALDFGFPVVKQDGDDRQVLNFTMGFFR